MWIFPTQLAPKLIPSIQLVLLLLFPFLSTCQSLSFTVVGSVEFLVNCLQILCFESFTWLLLVLPIPTRKLNIDKEYNTRTLFSDQFAWQSQYRAAPRLLYADYLKCRLVWSAFFFIFIFLTANLKCVFFQWTTGLFGWCATQHYRRVVSSRVLASSLTANCSLYPPPLILKNSSAIISIHSPLHHFTISTGSTV